MGPLHLYRVTGAYQARAAAEVSLFLRCSEPSEHLSTEQPGDGIGRQPALRSRDLVEIRTLSQQTGGTGSLPGLIALKREAFFSLCVQ